MPLSTNGRERASMIQREFWGSKRIRKILNPDFLFDRKFDIAGEEQKETETIYV